MHDGDRDGRQGKGMPEQHLPAPDSGPSPLPALPPNGILLTALAASRIPVLQGRVPGLRRSSGVAFVGRFTRLKMRQLFREDLTR
jgi:hypothetical protein